MVQCGTPLCDALVRRLLPRRDAVGQAPCFIIRACEDLCIRPYWREGWGDSIQIIVYGFIRSVQ